MSRAGKGSQDIAFSDHGPSPEVESRIIEFAYSLRLSLREGAVLLLAVGGGVERKETAHRLRCSSGTIDTYWRRILGKSGLESPLQVLAAVLAFAVKQVDWTAELRRTSLEPDEGDFQRYRSAIRAVAFGLRKV